MAQESIKINAEIVRNTRINVFKESQDVFADGCNMSRRTLQNIESGRGTTHQRARAIARYIGINVNELIYKWDPSDTLWHVTSRAGSCHSIVNEFSLPFDEIRDLVKRFSGERNPLLKIDNRQEKKAITFRSLEFERKWTIRPIKLDEKTGLLWKPYDDFQLDIWEDILYRLKYAYTNDVILDGKPLVPPNIAPTFIAEFSHHDLNGHKKDGYRLFNDAFIFNVSLQLWLQSLDSSLIFSVNHHDTGILFISYTEPRKLISRYIQIYCVWKDSKGNLHRAPWSINDIELTVEFIRRRTENKKSTHFPILIPEDFDIESAPSFSPNKLSSKSSDTYVALD